MARHKCPTCGYQDMSLLRQESKGMSVYECSKCGKEFPFTWPDQETKPKEAQPWAVPSNGKAAGKGSNGKGSGNGFPGKAPGNDHASTAAEGDGKTPAGTASVSSSGPQTPPADPTRARHSTPRQAPAAEDAGPTVSP